MTLPTTHISSSSIVASFISSIALISMFIYLWILFKMKWNGFFLILSNLACCQIIYNLSFFFLLDEDASWSYSTFLIFDLFGDLSSALWTNILSLIIFRIAYGIQTVNILKEYPYYLFIVISTPLSLIIFGLVTDQYTLDPLVPAFRVYNMLKLISVIFNIILYLLTSMLINKFPDLIERKILTPLQAQAIYIIITRMRYYSIVQVITRASSLWYFHNEQSLDSLAARWVFVIISPLQSVGYFTILLIIQPGALKLVLNRIIFQFFPCLKPKNEEEFYNNLNKLYDNTCGLCQFCHIFHESKLAKTLNNNFELSRETVAVGNNRDTVGFRGASNFGLRNTTVGLPVGVRETNWRQTMAETYTEEELHDVIERTVVLENFDNPNHKTMSRKLSFVEMQSVKKESVLNE